MPAIARLVFYHLAIATAIFWWLSLRNERRQPVVAFDPVEASAELRINYFRVLVPLLPLVLLFVTGPPFRLLTIPLDWVAEEKMKGTYGTRLIGFAMLVGVAAAALAAPRQAARIPRAFFEGAGYAFATVVSLIVTASCFGVAIEQIGLAARLAQVIQAAPDLLLPMAATVPLGFGALSGSGMASTQSLYGFFVKPAELAGLDRIDLGAVVSIAAAAGRTMSPVAAVTLMSATLTDTNPFALARRVALPLLLSWIIVVGLRIAAVI